MNRSHVDSHKLLGVTQNATEKEMRNAYRRMVMEYHPDRNQGDLKAAEKFKQVQWAYETLTEKKKEAFMPGKPGRYGSLLPGWDTHPFIGFFWAMGAYYTGIMRDRPDRYRSRREEEKLCD